MRQQRVFNAINSLHGRHLPFESWNAKNAMMIRIEENLLVRKKGTSVQLVTRQRVGSQKHLITPNSHLRLLENTFRLTVVNVIS